MRIQKDILIKDADYKDYKSLCEIFAQANTEHCEMRPDLYRPVAIAIPQSKYCLAITAKNLFGYQPVLLQFAKHEGRIVGAIFVQSLSRSKLSWSAFEKEAYLDNVVVVPDYRRQGIGSTLLRAAQSWSKKTGHTYMWGKIVNKNHASLALFKKAGFTADSSNVGCHLT